MHYRFSDFELDAKKAELRRNGEAVQIEPQVFDLLKLLISADGRLVSRDEMFRTLWGERIVSDAALSTRIKDARKALGDDGTAQKYIRTVQRRGLRFLGEVQKIEDVSGVDLPALQDAGTVGRATLAVFPLECLSPVPDYPGFDRALSDELIAALTHWRTFLIVSRASVRQAMENHDTAQDIGEALGAQYLLNGTIRHVGSKVKLSVTLTYAPENTEVWTERMVCDLESFEDPEEEIASRLSTLVSPELQAAEARRAACKDKATWTPWEKAMNAVALLRSGRRSDFEAAETVAAEASQHFPDWGLPMTLQAIARFQMAMAGFSASDSTGAFSPTLNAAQAALEIDQNDWMAHALIAVGELWTNRNHEKALVHVRKALQLNPSAGINHHFGGCIFGFSGMLDEARGMQERLFRIDPTYPYRAVIEADLGLWHMLGDNFDEAEQQLEKALSWDPGYGRAYQRQIALFGLKGDRDRAAQAAQRLRDMQLPIDPDVIAQSYPFLKGTHREMFTHGLQSAGINM